ncbi:CHAP domain-containing protein [Streptosporangium sp. DT93]|uniref:CHAP domain-containing protein n=1 Tax=Streptosporangium sp. DT93 TaxID=3393428 RepID=UPI003CF2781C
MELLKGSASHLSRFLRPVLAVTIAALGSAMISTTPATATTATAVSRSTIVSVAQGQLDNAARNAESPLGSGCNYYTGHFRSWKPSAGCPSKDGVQWRDSDWCADFSKYVWRNAGVPHADVPETSGGILTGWASSFKDYGVQHGTWHTRASGYTPQPGDAVVFDWDQSGDIDHVGIVSSSNAGTVYTIEGNSGDRIKANSYARSNVDIVGYSAPVGAAQVGGKASVYGVLADGRLTYNTIDAATGAFTVVTSTATLGFTPKAMATLNFNTLLITEDGPDGKLYRIDVQDNNGNLAFNPPIHLATGYTHNLLAYDGNTHLFGIANGVLQRYTINATKPTAANISTGTKIGPNQGTGFTLKTLTATASNWILGTTDSGALISYRITGDGSDYTRYPLRDSTWQVFDHLISPGGGVYLAHHTNDNLYRYTDTDPHDGNADDLTNHGTISTGGWTQTLLSAQPGTVN